MIPPEHCVAFVVTEGELPYHFGKRLKHSFHYFNNAVEFLHFTSDNTNTIMGDTAWWYQRPVESNWINWIRPQLVRHLLTQYRVVLMLDADVIVCAYLHPVWEGDYDVAGSLNVERFPGDKFLNIGVTAFTSKDFVDTWAAMAASKTDLIRYNNEQETFNILLGTHQQKFGDSREGYPYKLKILDSKKTKQNWNERFRGWLQDADVVNDEIIAKNGRQFMTIHHAGGCSFEDRLSSKVFPNYLRRHLNKICGVNDFTKHIGADYHYFRHKWDFN